MIRSFSAALLAFPLVSACATAPEPCTAEWFDWKTERIMAQFAIDHREEIGHIRSLAPFMLGPESKIDQVAPTSSLILTALGAVDLVLDFGSEAWPKVTDAVSECATAPDATKLFADMLRRENIDERAVQAIERLGNLVDFKR
ncbi:MAG: hypothetical protein R3C46_04705 [Hyphomonadaceae bacterium]